MKEQLRIATHEIDERISQLSVHLQITEKRDTKQGSLRIASLSSDRETRRNHNEQ